MAGMGCGWVSLQLYSENIKSSVSKKYMIPLQVV